MASTDQGASCFLWRSDTRGTALLYPGTSTVVAPSQDGGRYVSLAATQRDPGRGASCFLWRSDARGTALLCPGTSTVVAPSQDGGRYVSLASVERDSGRGAAQITPCSRGTSYPLRTFRMQGRDIDSTGPAPLYRYWTVTGSPDFTGTRYTGPKSGTSPLADIVQMGS